MRVAYLTSAISGVGRLVRGLAISQGLLRANVSARFVVFSYRKHPEWLRLFDVEHRLLPVEPQAKLEGEPGTTRLFEELFTFAPDVLLVDLLWFPVQHILPLLDCEKIFLARRTAPRFFRLPRQAGGLQFDPSVYDRLFSIEPFDVPFAAEQLSPIVLRNPEEVLDRSVARQSLGLVEDEGPHWLSAHANSETGKIDLAPIVMDAEARGVRLHSAQRLRLLPCADYYPAFDRVICGAGYNAFWETRWLAQNATYIPFPTRFEDQSARVETCRDVTMRSNGADDLARLLERG